MRISFEKRYFSLNRIILLAVGLWPYQQSKVVRFQSALFLGILISFIIFQFSRFFYVEYTFDPTLRIIIFCILLNFTFFTVIYISFSVRLKNMRNLLDWLQYIYNNLKDKTEIAIYDKYGNIAKRVTFIFIITAVCGFLILITIETWSISFDVIAPNNSNTYENQLKVIVYQYFAVQETYFYLFLVYLNTVISIASIALLATGTMLFSYFKHICGMFRIASYRLERAMQRSMLRNINLHNDIVIYKKMISAIDIHRKAMEFAKYFINSMELSLFLEIMIIVFCVSFNLYGISRSKSFSEKIEETILHLLVLIFIFIFMFLINFAGQEVTDCSTYAFNTAYNISWYLAPLHIQKLILFLLLRSNKTFTLNIGGLFVLSIEFFASLASASISYFTVILSFQY
ncbi:Or9e32 [Eciton burchellii]|nr:Or9e32 [Eciton burchellii]